MTPIKLFTLDRLEDSVEGPRSRVAFEGRPLETIVPGAVLEAQFSCPGGYLLLITEDCPYEEALHAYLLDSALQVADHIELGAPYSPGIFRDPHPAGSHAVDFYLFGREAWRITVHDRPRRSLKGKHRLEFQRWR